MLSLDPHCGETSAEWALICEVCHYDNVFCYQGLAAHQVVLKKATATLPE